MSLPIRTVRCVLLVAALTIVGAIGGLIARGRLSADSENAALPTTAGTADQQIDSARAIHQPANPAGPPAVTHAAAPVVVLKNAGTQAAANAVLQGDLLLREGRVSEAVPHFRQLLVDAPADPPLASVQYRLALCAESLGRDEEALATYQKVAKAIQSGEIGELAILGQARIFAKRNEHAAAQRLMRRWLLQENEIHPSAHWVAHDGIYRLGIVSAETALGLSDARLWKPEGLAHPIPRFEPSNYLPRTEAAPEISQTNSPLGIALLHQLGEAEPGSSYFQGRLARTSVHRVLGQIGEATSWSLEMTPAAEGRIRAQTIRLDFSELSADVVFDLLLAPLEVAWSYADGRVTIQTERELAAAEQEEYRRRIAERTLFAALLNEPEHSQAPASYLLLGNLAFQRGNLAAARGHYEKILQEFLRSRIDAEAWFNAAKVAMADGDLPRVHQALLGAVDSGRGSPLEPVALLLCGQNALLFDDPQKAIRPLMRAVTLAADQDVRALSLLSMASAHLIAGHPEAANVALMEDRPLLRKDAYRDRAALLACLARFQAASTAERKEREGRTLIAALCHAGTDQWTGLHDHFLTACAYRDVGLTELAIPLLETAVRSGSPSPLRIKMQFLFAQLLRAQGQADQAEIVLTALAQNDSPEISSRSYLALAELHLSQQEPDPAEEICRELLKNALTEELRVEALRLLGGIYADRGDRQRAVLCFSGVAPQLYDATRLEGAASPGDGGSTELPKQRQIDPSGQEGPL